METFVEDKIKVFISSKCGVENYDLIRVALKQLLESTGMIQTYVFEESSPVSAPTRDEYLNKLEDSHVILFLVDNESSITEGVMKEWKYSKELQRRAIYLFYNNPSKPVTYIQEELDGPYGAKYKIISNIKDFIRVGYQSVIIDILNTYNNYCKNRISLSSNETHHENSKITYTIGGENQGLFFERNKIHEFPLTLSYFKNIDGGKGQEEVETSQLDKFAQQFIMILHGERKFDSLSFTIPKDEFQRMHSKELAAAVLIRWEAIQRVFEKKLDEAIQKLEEAYTYSCEKQLPYWFVDDILIDKRNLEVKVMESSNSFCEVSAQQELKKRTHMLHYPLLDRFEGETYRNLLKEIYDVNIQSPYTRRIGSGLDGVIKHIYQTFIIAICYGSLTHIMSINELLYKVFFNFSALYNHFPWKYLSIKFCILNVDIKSLEKVYQRNQGIIASCSFEKIKELYTLAEAIPYTLESQLLKIKLIEILGYYFSDEDYISVNTELFEIIDIWLKAENPYLQLSPAISSCLKANINRLNHQLVVMKSLVVFNKKHYRFYDDFFSILIQIDWKQVKPSTFNEVVEVVKNILKDSDLRRRFMNFPKLVLSMRLKCNQLQEWDMLIRESWPTFYKSQYELETSERTPQNDVVFLLDCLDEINKRNEYQGREGRYSSFASQPFKTMRNIMLNSDLALDYELFHKILSVSTQVLLNPKQTTEEKVECIHFIIFFKGNYHHICEAYWGNFKEEILSNDANLYSSFEDDLFDQKTRFTLRTNIMFLKEILEESNKAEFFEILSMHYAATPYDNIQLLTVIERYLEYCKLCNIRDNSYFSIILQLVLSQTNDPNPENKLIATRCLIKFIDSEYAHVVYKSISYILDDADFRLKLWIIDGIKGNRTEEVKRILEKLITDNNYRVRLASKEVLNRKLR